MMLNLNPENAPLPSKGLRLGRTACLDIDGVPLFGFTEDSWRAETKCEACDYAITSLRGGDRHNGPAELRAALGRRRASRAAGETGVLLQCDRCANITTDRYRGRDLRTHNPRGRVTADKAKEARKNRGASAAAADPAADGGSGLGDLLQAAAAAAVVNQITAPPGSGTSAATAGPAGEGPGPGGDDFGLAWI